MNKNAIFAVAIGLVVLVGLFWYLKPTPTPQKTGADLMVEAAADPNRRVTPPSEREIVVVWKIKEGIRTVGPDVIRATEGARIKLWTTSDKADELHVHGYDLSAKLDPGVAKDLSFALDKSGRFEIELHEAHAVIGVLEVQPKQ